MKLNHKFSRALALFLVLAQVITLMVAFPLSVYAAYFNGASGQYVLRNEVEYNATSITVDGVADSVWDSIKPLSGAKWGKSTKGGNTKNNTGDMTTGYLTDPSIGNMITIKAYHNYAMVNSNKNVQTFVYFLVEVKDSTNHASGCTSYTDTVEFAFNEHTANGAYYQTSGTNAKNANANYTDPISRNATGVQTFGSYFTCQVKNYSDRYVIEGKYTFVNTDSTNLQFNLRVTDRGAAAGQCAGANCTVNATEVATAYQYAWAGVDAWRGTPRVWANAVGHLDLVYPLADDYMKSMSIYKAPTTITLPDMSSNTVSDIWATIPHTQQIGNNSGKTIAKMKAFYDGSGTTPVLYLYFDVTDSSKVDNPYYLDANNEKVNCSHTTWARDGINIQISENKAPTVSNVKGFEANRRTGLMARATANGKVAANGVNFGSWKTVEKADGTGYYMEFKYTFFSNVKDFALNAYVFDGGDESTTARACGTCGKNVYGASAITYSWLCNGTNTLTIPFLPTNQGLVKFAEKNAYEPIQYNLFQKNNQMLTLGASANTAVWNTITSSTGFYYSTSDSKNAALALNASAGYAEDVNSNVTYKAFWTADGEDAYLYILLTVKDTTLHKSTSCTTYDDTVTFYISETVTGTKGSNPVNLYDNAAYKVGSYQNNTLVTTPISRSAVDYSCGDQNGDGGYLTTKRISNDANGYTIEACYRLAACEDITKNRNQIAFNIRVIDGGASAGTCGTANCGLSSDEAIAMRQYTWCGTHTGRNDSFGKETAGETGSFWGNRTGRLVVKLSDPVVAGVSQRENAITIGESSNALVWNAYSDTATHFGVTKQMTDSYELQFFINPASENVSYKAFYTVGNDGTITVYFLVDVKDATKHTSRDCTTYDDSLAFYIGETEAVGTAMTAGGYNWGTFASKQIYRDDTAKTVAGNNTFGNSYFEAKVIENNENGYKVEAMYKFAASGLNRFYLNIQVVDGGSTGTCVDGCAETAEAVAPCHYAWANTSTNRGSVGSDTGIGAAWSNRFGTCNLVLGDYAKGMNVYTVGANALPDMTSSTVSAIWSKVPYSEQISDNASLKVIYDDSGKTPTLYLMVDVTDATVATVSSWKADGVNMQISERKEIGITNSSSTSPIRRSGWLNAAKATGSTNGFTFKTVKNETGWTIEIKYSFMYDVDDFAMNITVCDGDGTNATYASWTCDASKSQSYLTADDFTPAKSALMNFTGKSIDDSIISTLYGAGTRIDKNDPNPETSGLRWENTVNTAALIAKYGSNWAENATMGTIILPTDYLVDLDAFTFEALTNAGKVNGKDYLNVENWDNTLINGKTFYSAIVNIFEHNYDRSFSAVGYVMVGDDVYYGDYVELYHARSVKEVSRKAFPHYTSNTTALSILKSYLQFKELTVDGVDISKYQIVYAQSPIKEKLASSKTGKTIGEDLAGYLLGSEPGYTFDQQSAERLQALIYSITGVELKVVEDTASDPAEYEILVGITNRADSKAETAGKLSYFCKYTTVENSKKYVLYGGSYGATWHAVEALEVLLTESDASSIDLKTAGDLSAKSDLKAIACLGDSITYGEQAIPKGSNDPGLDGLYYQVGSTAAEFYTYNYLNYPSVLQRELWKDYVVYNYGLGWASVVDHFPGATDTGPYYYPDTTNFKNCVTDSNAEDFEFDLVLMMLGTNDTWRLSWTESDKTTFKTNYKNMIDAVLSGSPNATVAIMSVPHRCNGFGATETAKDKLTRTVQLALAQELAAQNYKVAYYDMGKFSRENMISDPALEGKNVSWEELHGDYYSLDTTHPIHRGYAKMAEGVESLVRYLMENGKLPASYVTDLK